MSRRDELNKVIDSLRESFGTIEDLKDQLQTWHDNLEGTNLENTAKYTELEDIIDIFESGLDSIANAITELEEIEFPSAYGG